MQRRRSDDRTVLRAGFSFWLYVALAAASVVAVLWVAIPEGTRHHLPQLAPIPIAIVLGGWVALGRPALIVEPERIVVRNPFVTVTVPAARLERYDTERGLTLHLDDGRSVHVWAAPPPDRIAAWRQAGLGPDARDPRLVREGGDEIRTSRLPGFPAGDAALVLEHQRRSGGGVASADAPVTRRVSVASLLVAAAAVVLPFAVASL